MTRPWHEELGRFFERFPARSAHRALELGCGRGEASRTVHELLFDRFDHPDSCLVCADLAHDAVRATRLGMAAAGLGRIHCVQADLLRLPVTKHWFDSVIALNLIHIVAPMQVVQAADRVLGPSGRLFARNYSPQLAIPHFSLVLDRGQVALMTRSGQRSL